MKWQVKVTAFKILSLLPGGTTVYRFTQERLTQSVVLTRDRLQNKIDVGLQFWNWLEKQGRSVDLAGGTHIDFGAGWHPTIPFLFYSLGVQKQWLLDIASRFDRRLIQETVRIFKEAAAEEEWGRRLKRQPEIPPSGTADEMLAALGMTNLAPYDPADPRLAGSADLVTSTQVLLHIDRDPMRECFRSIHQWLKPGGLFMATVHLKDLYSDVDPTISQYNHLRYSPWFWKDMINSDLMPFNRLKGPDYRKLLEETGFQIREFEIDPTTEEDLRDLARVPVHECFSCYSKEDLVAKHLFFVAEKA